MNRFLIINSSFRRVGGQERANHALASYLARQRAEVHLAGYEFPPDLADHPGVRLHPIRWIGRSYLLNEPRIRRIGARIARRFLRDGPGRIIANGANCPTTDTVWVHYVHAAWDQPPPPGLSLRSLKQRIARRLYLRYERDSLPRARLLVANSQATQAALAAHLAIPSDRIRVARIGLDPAEFRPAAPEQRSPLRSKLDLPADRPLAGFVGALGDSRKGFDRLFDAWQQLCVDVGFKADLIVLGSGADLPQWKQRARERGIDQRIRFLGHRLDVAQIVPLLDLLIAPARYEPFGMAVQEALACHVPALTSAEAGVAELYPAESAELLISQQASTQDFADRIRRMLDHPDHARALAAPAARAARAYTWDCMAADIVRAMEQFPPSAC